ncbi:hypothetical protein WJX73_010276 [Symbiochloris irregularis]|uniref:UAS domain-containing protein n=1 Tax=Symbiochloris irregularis TaxID=706552 RepID=A0AAW1P5B9_9CHLO
MLCRAGLWAQHPVVIIKNQSSDFHVHDHGKDSSLRGSLRLKPSTGEDNTPAEEKSVALGQSAQETPYGGGSMAPASEESQMSASLLAALYPPPIVILYTGTLQEAFIAALQENRLLLVHVQGQDIPSMAMNTGAFGDRRVQTIVGDHFIFVQVKRGTSEAHSLIEGLSLATLPALVVLQPLNAAPLERHQGFLGADRVLQILTRQQATASAGAASSRGASLLSQDAGEQQAREPLSALQAAHVPQKAPLPRFLVPAESSWGENSAADRSLRSKAGDDATGGRGQASLASIPDEDVDTEGVHYYQPRIPSNARQGTSGGCIYGYGYDRAAKKWKVQLHGAQGQQQGKRFADKREAADATLELWAQQQPRGAAASRTVCDAGPSNARGAWRRIEVV